MELEAVARMTCAALISALQQSVLTDLISIARLLCFLAVTSMTGCVLLRMPRRMLMYICNWPEGVAVMITAVLRGAAPDPAATTPYALSLIGCPRLALVCHLIMLFMQHVRISQQPWEVLVAATVLRICLKVVSHQCLAWLIVYCDKLPTQALTARRPALLVGVFR